MRASQREQERIGQDLHDGLCQVLSGIKFQAALLEQRLHQDRCRHAPMAAEIENEIALAIQQARGFARGLIPPELELGELAPALEALARNIEQRYGVKCVCAFDSLPPALDAASASHLYRIAREACANAGKHAQPRLIRIELAVRAGRFSLKVSNDGRGFRPATAGKGGMGLRLMHYRARALGASLTIRRGTQGGCVVQCRGRLPQPEANA